MLEKRPDDENEISPAGKALAGILLIVFTVLPLWLLFAYWPDRLAIPKDNLRPLYINEVYHVRLACIPDSAGCVDTFYVSKPKLTLTVVSHDSAKPPKDSIQNDTTHKIEINAHAATVSSGKYYTSKDLIDLNTIIMILVAAGGFLGNMIHVATSFTTFVGAGQFKNNWLLWYFVKPFTAAALALGLYFVFRGGFLNYSADASSINLFGTLTISVLTGLFTDRATLKLGEIFEVVFSIKKDVKSDDGRPDKLDPGNLSVTAITPETLKANGENVISIHGQNLDKAKLTATINGELVVISNITSSELIIKYSITPTQKDKTKFELMIKDDKGKMVTNKEFTLAT